MKHSELMSRVIRAVNTLYARDSNLLTGDSSEWSIAHRLAVNLEQEIPGWNVDCEYNRQGNNIKKESNDNPVRPDIIIHHRAHLEIDHNLLAIELKKSETDSDLKKVQEYTKPPESSRKFQYQYGLALCLVNVPTLHWFTQGKELSQPSVACDAETPAHEP